MSHITLLEDDPVLGRSLMIKLELEGYKVHWVKSIGEAHQQVEQKSDLWLVDVSLPDGSGIDFIRDHNEYFSKLPVFVLTARTDEDTAVESLSVGATDFVRKPFGQRELMVRIKKALAEPVHHEKSLRLGALTAMPQQRRILHGEVEIDFNRKEFDILYFLMQNVDRVVSREMLIQMMKSEEIVDRTVDSHISHIRSKMKDHEVMSVKIASVYGVGYRLEKSS